MRAKEFIKEDTGPRGTYRTPVTDEFKTAHPGLVAPAGRGDLYIGRYYDFYRVASLAGMDPDELDKVDEISFFGNLPLYSAYTEYDRKKLKKILTKLGMQPKDYIPFGSSEKNDINNSSPVKSFKGYKRR